MMHPSPLLAVFMRGALGALAGEFCQGSFPFMVWGRCVFDTPLIPLV